MEIIKNFGVNPILTVAQIVNFLVILYIFRRFLYKPIFDIFKKREDIIKEGLANADEGKKILENAGKEEKEIIKKANNQAEKIVDDANDQAHNIIEKAQTTAKKQADIMLEEAKQQIARDAKKTEQKLISRIAQLMEKVLKEATQEFISDKEQSEIVKKALKKLEAKKYSYD